MKKTYTKPETRVVWLGLIENVLENVGGLDSHSCPGTTTDPNEGSWVKGERDWSDDVSLQASFTNLWDDEW